jgi:hypothetical protein
MRRTIILPVVARLEVLHSSVTGLSIFGNGVAKMGVTSIQSRAFHLQV